MVDISIPLCAHDSFCRKLYFSVALVKIVASATAYVTRTWAEWEVMGSTHRVYTVLGGICLVVVCFLWNYKYGTLVDG